MTIKTVELKLIVGLDDANGSIEQQALHLGWSLEHNLPRTSSDPMLHFCKVNCEELDNYSDKLTELTQRLNEKLESHNIIKSAQNNLKAKTA